MGGAIIMKNYKSKILKKNKLEKHDSYNNINHLDKADLLMELTRLQEENMQLKAKQNSSFDEEYYIEVIYQLKAALSELQSEVNYQSHSYENENYFSTDWQEMYVQSQSDLSDSQKQNFQYQEQISQLKLLLTDQENNQILKEEIANTKTENQYLKMTISKLEQRLKQLQNDETKLLDQINSLKINELLFEKEKQQLSKEVEYYTKQRYQKTEKVDKPSNIIFEKTLKNDKANDRANIWVSLEEEFVLNPDTRQIIELFGSDQIREIDLINHLSKHGEMLQSFLTKINADFEEENEICLVDTIDGIYFLHEEVRNYTDFPGKEIEKLNDQDEQQIDLNFVEQITENQIENIDVTSVEQMIGKLASDIVITDGVIQCLSILKKASLSRTEFQKQLIEHDEMLESFVGKVNSQFATENYIDLIIENDGYYLINQEVYEEGE